MVCNGQTMVRCVIGCRQARAAIIVLLKHLQEVRWLLSRTPAVHVNTAAEGGQKVIVAGDVKPENWKG